MKTPGVNFDELLDRHRPEIEALERAEGAGEVFARRVRELEGAVIGLYQEAVGLARHAERVEEAASVWNSLSRYCQAALQALTRLREKYPEAGAPEVYDLILDYKLAADKRHRQLLEDLACQQTPLPPGLLPEPS